jgi:hypothetical protein
MMERDDFFKNELVQELRYASNQMRKDLSVEKKIFYFSAAYGITSRTFRYSFSKDVLLADLVCTQVYQMLQARFVQLGGMDVGGQLEKKLGKLCDELTALADRFESGDSILEPIENILTIGYSTTGNGLYLEERGDLKL